MITIGTCRNRTTSVVQTPSAILVPRRATLEGLERAGPPRQQEVDRHHDERDRSEGRCEREVARGAEAGRVDDVADERRPRAADERRSDVVAERQREGEDRAGDNAGK